MKPYIPPDKTSCRPGCGCCVPNKSGHGHRSRRRSEGTEAVRRNAKKAARREGRKTIKEES